MVARKTTEEFVEEAKNTWGDRYDYSESVYTNAKTKVSIICLSHGEFQQRADHHINGRVGCPYCYSIESSSRPRKSRPNQVVDDTSSFIAKAEEVWGDRWDYGETEYHGAFNKVVIICRIHGPFEQTPSNHLQGSVACGSCRGVSVDTASFILNAKKV